MTLASGAPSVPSWTSPLFAAGGRNWRPGVAATLARMQKDAMAGRFPGMRLMLDLPWVTIWEGGLRPLSTTYRVRVIDHRGLDDGRIVFAGRWPVVRVLSPSLSRRDAAPDEPVPHLFGDHDDPAGAHLCLFYPDGADWTDEMLLANSIVPWAAEWIFYYEMWHVAGVWGGPEVPHTPVHRGSGEGTARSGGAPHRLRPIDCCTMRSMPYLVDRIAASGQVVSASRLAA